jgi:hypothetical protein
VVSKPVVNSRKHHHSPENRALLYYNFFRASKSE